MNQTQEVLEIPENFKSSIQDFAKDLCLTFPEYESVLSPCFFPTGNNEEVLFVYSHCLKMYPQRFFDILYQNDDLFLPTNDENVEFLPGVDFRVLFNLPDVSESTKQTMWKYLQLILITIMSSVKDKTTFGETMNLFDGIDDTELQTKLTDTISNLTNFFKDMDVDADETGTTGNGNGNENGNENGNGNGNENENGNGNGNEDGSSKFEGIDPTGIHEHLKSLFDGKIGKLAKELADELSGDLMNMFGEDAANIIGGGGAGAGDMKSTQDIFKKLMKNPKKIMELLKTVGSKLESKMKDGDISKEDIMKEASELMGKMKDMGNGKEFQEMMKNLTKNMGGMSGMGLGKDAKFDFSAMERQLKKGTQAEKMREKLEKKKAAAAAAGASLESVGDKHFVFKTGNESQPKSSVRPVVDDWLDEPTVAKKSEKTNPNKKKKNKK